MRKTIFTAALSCTLAAGTAQAQKLLYDSGETFVVPSQLTSAGKAILGSYDYNESTHVIKLYDENLKETKSVTLNLPVGVSGSWTEEATVIPTGAKADLTSSPDIYIHDADESIDAASIKSIVALANAMNQYYGYEDDSDWRKYTGFTDIDGRISCYNESYSFYLNNFFDKQYPYQYISLVDGHICHITRSYLPVYNEDEAQWKKVPGSESTYQSINRLETLCYTDYDANIHFSDMKPYCSQTLFNDDNSWEFIVPVMEEKISYSTPWVDDPYGDDGVILRRRVEQFMNETALKVVNENGNDILTLEMGSIYNIFRLNNKVYVEGGYSDSNKYYSVIYCLDGKGNAIKTVHAASRPKLANVGDGVIDVNVGEEKGHVILTNMGGSLIDRKQTNGEAVIRLDTRHLPKGIYNVTLQREGHTIANEKVMVK